MMMPTTMILTICISMVLKRNRGLSLDIGSRHERAEHKTHNSNHKSQKLNAISATNWCFDIICTLCWCCWIGTGGRSRPLQTKIFSHQCGGHLQPVGVKHPQLPDKSNTGYQANLLTYLFMKSCISTCKQKIHCVSKNIPDIFSCNSRKHCQIFIISGTHATEKVSNQEML